MKLKHTAGILPGLFEIYTNLTKIRSKSHDFNITTIVDK